MGETLIKRWLIHSGMSQSEFTKRIGAKSVAYVANLINGHYTERINIDILLKISDVTDLSVREILMDLKKNRPPRP